MPLPYSLSRQYSVFLLLFFVFVPFHCPAIEKPEIKVFVNSSVPVKQYTLTDVRAIFAMRKTHWPDGTRIQVFVLSDNDPLHRQFTKSRLNMFPHQFRRIWDRLIFSGTGHAPNQVKSIEEMLNKISTIPGAVGYLNEQPKSKKIRIINYE